MSGTLANGVPGYRQFDRLTRGEGSERVTVCILGFMGQCPDGAWKLKVVQVDKQGNEFGSSYLTTSDRWSREQ